MAAAALFRDHGLQGGALFRVLAGLIRSMSGAAPHGVERAALSNEGLVCTAD
jgi:hypothetical protein